MRIAIVDDDEKQRKQLREFVERYSSEKSLDAVSFIVNLAHVSSIVGNDVYVGKVSLPISRSRKKEFVADVNRYFGGI